MRKFRNAAAVMALMATPAMAQPQKPSTCLTRGEAYALFAFALPEMVDSIRQKCVPSLAQTSFLTSQGSQLVARYRASTASSWPAAKAAFLKIAADEGDGAKLMAKVSDDTLRGLVVAALNVAITDDVKPADCPHADRLVQALAPLPAPNLATVIVEIMGLAGSKDKKDPLDICKDS